MSRPSPLVTVAALLVAGVGLAVYALRVRPTSTGPTPDPTRPSAPRLTGPRAVIDASRFDPPLRGALEKALANAEASPDDADAWGDLGKLCHAHGLHEEARRAYAEAREIDPDDSLWPHLLGIICERLGRIDDAVTAYERSIAMEEFDIVSRCSLARILAERGDELRARELYVAAIAIDSRSVAARVGLGQLALRAGALEMAERNLQTALEEYPRCGPAHSSLAQLRERQNRTDEARFHGEWSRVCGGRVPLPDPYVEEIDRLGVTHSARLRLARTALGRRSWTEAIGHLRAAIELRGDDPELRLLLGDALLADGRADDAFRELEKAAASEETRVDAWLRIARARAARAEAGAARAAVAKALDADPRSAEALIVRARLLHTTGQPEEARTSVKRALDLDPDSASACLTLGDLLSLRSAGRDELARDPALREREHRRARSALNAYERARELQPDLAGAYAGAGSAHMQLRELTTDPAERSSHAAAAVQRFRQLLIGFPDLKRGHVALIRALHGAGREQEMLEAIRHARARWPDDPQFRPSRRGAATGPPRRTN